MRFFPLLLLISFLQACGQPIAETSYSCPPTAIAYDNIENKIHGNLYVWPDQFQLNPNSFDNNNNGCIDSEEYPELRTEYLRQNNDRIAIGTVINKATSDPQENNINYTSMWGSTDVFAQRIQIHENFNAGTFGFYYDIKTADDQFLWLGFSEQEAVTSIKREDSWLQIEDPDSATFSCQVTNEEIKCVSFDQFQAFQFTSKLPKNARKNGYFYFWLCQQDNISQDTCSTSEYSAIAVNWHI